MTYNANPNKGPKLGQYRLRNPSTGLFLHASGKGETTLKGYPWMGFKSQAAKLASRATDWPYVTIHKDIADGIDPLHRE